MPVIGTSGSTSGDGKRRVAAWPKRPRPSSTLPSRTSGDVRLESAKWATTDIDDPRSFTNRDFMSESERDDSARDREQNLLGRRQLGTIVAARE